MDRTADLIQRHLDRGLADDERDELERAIAHDPDVADRFARACRLEQDLSDAFRDAAETAEARERFAAIAQDVHDGPPSAAIPPGALRAARRTVAAPGDVARVARDRRFAPIVLVLVGGTLAAAVLALVVPWSRWFGAEPDLPPPVAHDEHRPDDPSGATRIVSGTVRGPGSGRVETIADGRPIDATGTEPAVVRLADGSQVELEPGSRAVVHGTGPDEGARRRVDLVAGGALFQVEHGEGRFQVETELGRVTALGTIFSVRLRTADGEPEADRLAVAVLEGRVEVEFAGRRRELQAPANQVFARRGEGDRGPPELKGTLVALTDAGLELSTGGDRPQRRAFPIEPDARVLIDGQSASLAALRPGMQVHVQRLAGSETLVGIRAEGRRISGVLVRTDPAAGTVVLVARRGGERPAPEIVHPVSDSARIVRDGQPVGLADLRPEESVVGTLSVDGRTIVRLEQGRRGERERSEQRAPRPDPAPPSGEKTESVREREK